MYAEEHIEDTDPPLFLRFINLLINDAIFLLDEALDVSLMWLLLLQHFFPSISIVSENTQFFASTLHT